MKRTYAAWKSRLLVGIGTGMLLYFTYLSLVYGPFYISFSWSFLIIGLFLTGIGVWEQRKKRQLFSLLSPLWRKTVRLLLAAGLLFFVFQEGCLLFYGANRDKKQEQTLIVLGAQLNGTEISRLLRYRLDAAAEFAEEHPNSTLIVSGGQGAGESISEAEAMKAYLVEKGVEEGRIVMEMEARNTEENFRFSKQLLGADKKVSVVTNDFHMYRSLTICAQQGLSCKAYPAKGDRDLALNFYFREFFALLKDKYAKFFW